MLNISSWKWSVKGLVVTQKKTEKDFIDGSKLVHGSTYDYSRSLFQSWTKPVIIVCPSHGEFKQTPFAHVTQQRGCRICNRSGWKKPKETHSFIKDAQKIHGGRYRYDQTVYTHSHDWVKVYCFKHGYFDVKASGHLRKKNPHGCKECGKENTSLSSRLSQSEFLKRAKEIHGNRYDYSLVEYTRLLDTVEIVCEHHGVFEQRADVHLKGSGCQRCARLLMDIGYSDRYENTSVYLVEFTTQDFSFLKVGIALDVKNRIKSLRCSIPYENVRSNILYQIHGPSVLLCDFEKNIHKSSSYKHHWCQPFSGFTECYKIDEKDKLLFVNTTEFLSKELMCT